MIFFFSDTDVSRSNIALGKKTRLYKAGSGNAEWTDAPEFVDGEASFCKTMAWSANSHTQHVIRYYIVVTIHNYLPCTVYGVILTEGKVDGYSLGRKQQWKFDFARLCDSFDHDDDGDNL